MTISQPQSETLERIKTPRGSGGILAQLLAGPTVPALAARFGAALASLSSPWRIGTNVIVARHAHAAEVLSRDLDFRIAPINDSRIETVNGPFVLGMDRGERLVRERAALYGALAAVDLRALREQIRGQAMARVSNVTEVDIVGQYARPIAAATASKLFGIPAPDDALFMEVARAIFAHTFLNLSGDKTVEARAVAAASLIKIWISAEIEQRASSGAFGDDMMGALLREGSLDREGIRRTLGGMFVGSVDTTATAVAKIIAIVAGDEALQSAIAKDLDDFDRLRGWCWEVLRRWPHNPILLRQAAADTTLGDVAVSAGDRIIVWTQAAMLDAGAFPDPKRLRPDRDPKFYLHFGGGLHICAGRSVNAFQIPLLVQILLRRGIVSLGKMQWAGPFPDQLTAKFRG